MPRIGTTSEHAEFLDRVYRLIGGIPPGSVATYGQIARLAGRPRSARQVGRALANTPGGMELPWHRVINSQGKIAKRGGASHTCGGTSHACGDTSHAYGDNSHPEIESLQMRWLKREGVRFRNGRVDLTRFGWRPEEAPLDPEVLAIVDRQ